MDTKEVDALETELENFGRQKCDGRDYLEFCLLIRRFKQAAFDDGVNFAENKMERKL